MRGAWLSLVFLGLVSLSCSATYDEKIAVARDAYFRGDIDTAEAQLGGLYAEYGEGHGEYNCLRLEESIVKLASGNPAQAEEILREVRDNLDAIEREEFAAFSNDVFSYFSDDRSQIYPGEDYEKIMIRVMLALANLLQGGEEVIAYSNQVLLKQREILDQVVTDADGKDHKFKADYKKVGTGAYLYGVVTELDPTAGSEALVSYKRVKEWEPRFSAIDGDLNRLQSGPRVEEGHGALYVFAMVGQGPIKVEVEEGDLTFAAELALQFTRFIPQLEGPFSPTMDLSPLRIASVQPSTLNDVDSVSVSVGGRVLGVTETLTDVTDMAVQQYEATKSWRIAKAIIRRAVKKAIVTGAKGAARMAVESGGDSEDRDLAVFGIEVLGVVANTVWSAMERADTRQWSLLPDQMQVLRVELPVGEHYVDLSPQRGGRASGPARSIGVEIRDAENTYVLAFVPTGAAYSLLTSRPATGTTVARVE